jgi:hypothetical protein
MADQAGVAAPGIMAGAIVFRNGHAQAAAPSPDRAITAPSGHGVPSAHAPTSAEPRMPLPY